MVGLSLNENKTKKMSRRRVLRKIVFAIGAAFLSLPGGLVSFWGNLTVYVDSYLFSVVGSTYVGQASWVMSVFIMCWSLSMLLLAPIRKLIGKYWSVLSGMVLATIAVFLAYASLHSSMVWLIITLGAMFGFGIGITNAWLLQAVVDIADNDIGLLSSVLFAAGNGGAMLVNEFATLYINPLNLPLVFELGDSKYFIQKQVVDKVPSFFLIFGLFTAVTMTLGFCLLISVDFIPMPPDRRTKEENHVTTSTPNYGTGSQVELDAREQSNANADAHPMQELNTVDSPTSLHSQDISASQDPSGSRDYTVKEIFRTPAFYAVWISFFFAEFPYLLVTTFYKVFGQIYIHDDHFLTDIGTLRAFFNLCGRLVWGAAMDKLGVKNFLLMIISTLIITLIWYYFTALLDKWLYLVATVMVGNLGTAYFTSYIGVAAHFFGRKNVSTKLGIIRSSTIVLNLVAPTLFTVMFANLGWFYTSTVICVMNLLSLTLLSKFLPDI